MSTMPHIVVLGNEKGGSGKSTTAMHIVVACLRAGLDVGVLDLDGRQKSLTRYLENRRDFAQKHGLPLKIPVFESLAPSTADTLAQAREEEEAAFEAAVQRVGTGRDILVIDCPGANSHLGRLGHVRADTLITPINDSFVDFDLLGKIDPSTYKVTRPSFYAEMVWEARKVRAQRGGTPIDWIVMRNRLATLDAHNKRRVERAVADLARRVGFRFVPGLCERVIYRELFVKGLTLLDLRETRAGGPMTMSHVAARQELRDLVMALKLPGLGGEEAVRSA
ncbi:MAG: ATPase [Alphaproteobacteria bacterium]|nr:MAG: ATPase [Alphaproteobacteria bacterium]